MKNNKKIIVAFSLIGLLSMNILKATATGAAVGVVNAANTNIILNLTGKLIQLHFHNKVSKFADAYTPLRPLMISGAPITGIEAVTTTMLPQAVNMHKMTCHSVTASLGNGKKTKKDKVEPCTITIPDLKTFNDFKVTMEKNSDGKERLIFTKCNSIRLVPLKNGADKQDISRANSNTYVSKSAPVIASATTATPIAASTTPAVTAVQVAQPSPAIAPAPTAAANAVSAVNANSNSASGSGN